MWIFVAGVGLFMLGAVLNAVGWSMHRRTVGELPQGLLDWFVDVLKSWYSLLTGPESTLGERIAALGAIISALGILTAVAGLIAWTAA